MVPHDIMLRKCFQSQCSRVGDATTVKLQILFIYSMAVCPITENYWKMVLDTNGQMIGTTLPFSPGAFLHHKFQSKVKLSLLVSKLLIMAKLLMAKRTWKI